ncbi:MAG: cell division protein FtsX [Alphaproteobacteria bacterium]
MPYFMPGDKKLGVAQGKRKYDLPLNKSAGTGFLILLIGLMTFLAVMALAGSFALSSLAQHWSSGLENKLTIEIPAENDDQNIRTAEEIQSLATKMNTALQKMNFVRDSHILSREEITKLLSPWLGEGDMIADIPLPGLISVDLVTFNPALEKRLRNELTAITPNLRIDTHQDWLSDILKLTGSLQFATILISLIIGFTTAIAIAGAVKSRIAIHRKDVELLHLMGASDIYISKQFQRHAWILALQGSAAGMVCGFVIIMMLGYFSSHSADALLPDFSLNMVHIFAILFLPALACLIAGLTAKFTVLRELAQMP